MKFGKVPEIAKKARPWAVIRPIGAPPGLENQIGTLNEVQVEQFHDGSTGLKVFRVFVDLEEGDIEKLKAGNPLEFGVVGYQLQPILVNVWPDGGKTDE